ncbi:MAG: hypothetical protein Q8R92_08910 [Deltaproteobacteria bacterium]|nr:hypothetical protein [Deltaproteobacteria bacterium]
MTLDEAQKVASIVATADHSCSVCVGNLVDQLNEAFPEFYWAAADETVDVQPAEAGRK